MKFQSTLLILAIFMLFGVPFSVFAQTIQCDTPEQKAFCQAALVQVEADQKQAEQELASAQAESSSIAGNIAVLSAKIKVAQLNIKAKNLVIANLGKDIQTKVAYIGVLDDRISRGKDTLAVILRKTNETGAYSLPEVLLSQTSLTGFFTDVDAFSSVQEGLKSTFEQIRSDKTETQSEKDALDKRKNIETDARQAILTDQKNIQANEKQKQQLLAVSKGNEQSYATLLAQKKAIAAQIRTALFQLRDSAAIPFGTALKYTQTASAKTGVRPAFLLAILTQESNLGANVGSCYLTNNQTGEGVGANTGTPITKVMSPSRDVPPFLDIMSNLGGDPSKQRVSCPQSVGWGGAMGPAQFIASTWVLIKDRVASLLGISSEPNPWNPEHAIMAEAIYLSDRGASDGTFTSERNAACRYYSGSSCKGISTSYGNSVMSLADSIQRTKIDPLQGL